MAPEVNTSRHRSKGSVQEIFNTISSTLRDDIIADLAQTSCFGVLCDDVCDVSTIEQMITFVWYVKNGRHLQVKFLAISNRLENSPSANAQTTVSMLCEKLTDLNIGITKIKSVVTDGAAVIVGKSGGVQQG